MLCLLFFSAQTQSKNVHRSQEGDRSGLEVIKKKHSSLFANDFIINTLLLLFWQQHT